jgi:hypothetical protein
MTKDEALKLALEALKTIDEAMPFPVAKLAQAAIKEALAQPVQEPIGSVVRWLDGSLVHGWFSDPPPEGTLLYITPPAVQPQRPWVGLTDEEINACDPSEEFWGLHKIARALETKLKEKNTWPS